MADRLVSCSSRYQGPAGDSRPAAEIFAGIEARAKQIEEHRGKLIAAMDDVMKNATLLMWESRADLVRDVAVDWLEKNHPDFMEAAQEEGERG